MTNSMEVKMVEPREDSAGRHSTLWMMLSGLGIVMTAGAIAGFLAEHQAEGGGPLETGGIITLSIFAVIIAGLSFVIWRNGAILKGSSARLPRREKMSQRIMVFSCLLGGAIAIALMAASTAPDGQPDILAGGPIQPWVAIVLAAVSGIGMPILSIYWHNRVIDEQEADAYRTGALIAIYVYWMGAPVWWLLWRGGLVPAPDGVAIYLITTFTALIVWFWKKYR